MRILRRSLDILSPLCSQVYDVLAVPCCTPTPLFLVLSLSIFQRSFPPPSTTSTLRSQFMQLRDLSYKVNLTSGIRRNNRRTLLPSPFFRNDEIVQSWKKVNTFIIFMLENLKRLPNTLERSFGILPKAVNDDNFTLIKFRI